MLPWSLSKAKKFSETDVREGPEMKDLGKKLGDWVLGQPEICNWEELAQVGLLNQIKDNIVYRYTNYYDETYINMFRNSETAYKELCVEFLASFSFHHERGEGLYNINPTVHFRLLGDWHKKSLAEFGYLLGLHDSMLTLDSYIHHLNDCDIRVESAFDDRVFWREISNEPLDKHNWRTNYLKSSKIRLLHRLWGNALDVKDDKEKLNQKIFVALYYMLNREDRRLHIPYMFTKFFKEAKGHAKKQLVGGNFITMIAKRLDLFGNNGEVPRGIKADKGLRVRYLGKNWLATSKIMLKEGYDLRIIENAPPLGGAESSAAAAKRAREAGQEGPAEEVNLMYLKNLGDDYGRLLSHQGGHLWNITDRQQWFFDNHTWANPPSREFPPPPEQYEYDWNVIRGYPPPNAPEPQDVPMPSFSGSHAIIPVDAPGPSVIHPDYAASAQFEQGNQDGGAHGGPSYGWNFFDGY